MEYIQLENFNGNLFIVCKDDGSGEPLIFDSLKEAEDTLDENCQNGMVIPLNTNIIQILKNCEEFISTAVDEGFVDGGFVDDELTAELDEVLQLK